MQASEMIEFKQGNLLEENAEALVNTVNCVGVMGFPTKRHWKGKSKIEDVQAGLKALIALGSAVRY